MSRKNIKIRFWTGNNYRVTEEGISLVRVSKVSSVCNKCIDNLEHYYNLQHRSGYVPSAAILYSREEE